MVRTLKQELEGMNFRGKNLANNWWEEFNKYMRARIQQVFEDKNSKAKIWCSNKNSKTKTWM